MSSCCGIHWSLITECLQSMHEMSVNIVDFDSNLIQNQIASAHGFPEETYANNTPPNPGRCMLQFPGYPSVHMDLQCTACSFSPHHCSWLQGKFSARFVTWEPPHWWKTKCNVTWQGFKNKESLVCNIITFIPNSKIMYVKWCNWPLFCTLAFINIYMYLKIKIMCVYTYILRKQLNFVNMNVTFLWETLYSVNTTAAYVDNLWTMTKINGGQHRYNL